jgi:SAM-dependent methyltransferase
LRDPLATIELTETEVLRSLHSNLDSDHFLRTENAQEMIANGMIVPFEFVDQRTLRSPKIPFVSYPHEWCDRQFLDAAHLTLEISERVLGSGYELKDASAWNIIFDHCKPVFCDHLSFEKIASNNWFAFGQFVRHFIFPLTLRKFKQINAHLFFKLSRDGIQPFEFKRWFGFKVYLTRYCLLLLGMKNKTKGEPHKSNVKFDSNSQGSLHNNLYQILRWFLGGAFQVRKNISSWSMYEHTRTHYSEKDIEIKRQYIKALLFRLSPNSVVDLGCNSGEFSIIAALNGADVVSVDLDHDCIQKLYLDARELPISPVIANLEDLNGGVGWCGNEFPGLIDRLGGSADILMMLALVHHLAISTAISYEKIAKLASGITKQFLIIELLDLSDPLVCSLARSRGRSPEEFSIAKQKRAFLNHFNIVESIVLPNIGREIILMVKK